MTPYGIVYRDNPYALQKSVEIWQKKFGVYNLPTFLKIGVPSALIIIVIGTLLSLFETKDTATDTRFYFLGYIALFVIMVALSVFVVYRLANSTYVKQMALTNTQKEDKQIIIYEDRIEYGTAYTRSTYYYSDIVLCREQDNIITIIVDTAAMPLSIQTSSVLKGSYDEFSFILRKYMGSKYEYMGGKG